VVETLTEPGHAAITSENVNVRNSEVEYSFNEQELESDNESGPEFVDSTDVNIGLDKKSQTDELSESTKKAVNFVLALRTECGVNKTKIKTAIEETKVHLEYGVDTAIEALSGAGCSVEKVD